MNILRFFGFQRNTKTITHDPFTVAKLELGEVVLKKMQDYMESLIEERHGSSMYQDRYVGDDLKGDLALNVYALNTLKNLDQEARKLISDKASFPDMKEKRRSDYKLYQKPCFDQINQTVIPWYEQRMERLGPDWRKLLVHKTSAEERPKRKYVRSAIDPEEAGVAHGRHAAICDMLVLYHHLAKVTPEDISPEELTEYGMDMVEQGSFKDLSAMLDSRKISDTVKSLFGAAKPN